jgi:hypothetical protein
MQRLTQEEARAQGYTIDTTIYPHVAYKGPRFAPTVYCNCYTDLEADLLALRDAVEKLIKAKGRFHTEQNYAALVAAFDKVKP